MTAAAAAAKHFQRRERRGGWVGGCVGGGGGGRGGGAFDGNPLVSVLRIFCRLFAVVSPVAAHGTAALRLLNKSSYKQQPVTVT